MTGSKETRCNPDFEKFLGSGEKPATGFVYVAAPYYDDDKELMLERHDTITRFTAALVTEGAAAFSPVTYTANLDQYQGRHPDGWYSFDLHFLHYAKALVVLTLPGWKESKGVLTEMGYARGIGIPVKLVTPEEVEEALRGLQEGGNSPQQADGRGR